MGKYSYESLKSASQNQEATKEDRELQRVGYFNLTDEKPSAIVRFDVNSTDDLEIVDVHNVKITRDDKTYWRNIACLRNNDEPFKNCPLCAKDIKTRSTRVFVRMLEYSIVDGKVVATPTVWTRYSNFADELVTLLNQYGDLREHLFKVTRDVSSGKTKYTVLYQPEMGIYTEAAGYVKDFSRFEKFLVNKHSYMERTFEELEKFVKTGVMASRKPKEEQESKNLEKLIPDEKTDKEVEQALSMSQADTYVEAPVPANDELPFNTKSVEDTPLTRERTTTSTREDTPLQRPRKYNFD